MKSCNRIKICTLLMIYLMIPTIGLISNSNVNEGLEKDTEFTLSDINYESNPISAEASNLTFSGYKILQTPSMGSVNYISSTDLTKNQSYIGEHENYEDLIISDSLGNVYLQEGINQNPFQDWRSATWTNTLSINYRHLMTKNFPSENILYSSASKVSTNEKYRTHILTFSESTGYLLKFDPTQGDSLKYFTNSQWTPINKSIDNGLLAGQTINSIQQIDLESPYINGEFLLTTNEGKIIRINSENHYNDEFEESLIYESIEPVLQVQLDDINIDGFYDVVALFDNGTIKVFLGQNGYSNWDQEINLNTADSTLETFILADLNNDAFSDIIAANNNGQIYFWKNDYTSSNGFGSAYSKNDFNTKVNDIKVADLDNDNDLELIFALNNGSIAILENHFRLSEWSSVTKKELWSSLSTNNLDETILSDIAPYAVYSLHVIDLNEDGKLDILSGHANGYVYGWKNTLESKINPFNLGRELEIADSIISKNLKDIAFGDIDRDGDQDIVAVYNAGGAGTSSMYFYYNPGSDNLYLSSFTSQLVYAPSGDFKELLLEDLDFDGDLDIIFSFYDIYGDISIQCLKNDYDNSSGIAFMDIPWISKNIILKTLPDGLDGPISLDDYDGDGDLDFIIQSFQGNLTAYQLDNIGLDPFTSAFYSDWFQGNIIANTSQPTAISGLDFQDVEAYLPEDNSYAYATTTSDMVFADILGNVYYLPGQIDMLSYRDETHDAIIPNDLIYSNESNSIENVFYVYDKFLRKPSILFGGPTGTIFEKDSGYLSTLTKGSIKDVSNWIFTPRLNIDNQIFDCIPIDMNQDGSQDIIFRDEYLNIYVAEGLDQYYANFEEQFPIHKLFNGSLSIEPNGLRATDLDGDGDQDLVILTSDDKIYFLKNALDDDVSLDFIDLQVKTPLNLESPTSASWVNITVSIVGAKTVQQTPELEITYQGETEYRTMNVIEPGKEYYLIYNLKGNGTYFVSTEAIDQWNNLGFALTEFYGDFIPPELLITHDIYSNGTFEIFIYNTTESIGYNQIGLNISVLDPVNRVFYFETDISADYSDGPLSNKLYYLNNNTWWIRFTRAESNGIIDIGANATDIFLVNYTYSETSIINDINPPEITITELVTKPLRNTVLSIDNPQIPFFFEFTETVDYIKFWVEDSNENNVLYGEDYYEFYGDREELQTYFRSEKYESLILKIILKDIAGNYAQYSYSFYLEPIHIQTFPSWFYVISEAGNKEITYSNYAFVHFKANSVYQFRLRFDGLNDSINGAWSEWKEYDISQDLYYQESNPSFGYLIYFKPYDYGEKTIELEFRNGYETITMNATTIVYEPIEQTTNLRWDLIIGIPSGFVAVVLVLAIGRKIVKGREWKQYLSTGDDKDEI